MPCSRTGRSTSTTPWSKSMSITRSATMHSRPIETCWNDEIVHSCPITVLAPMCTSPSCARIFEPWPIHDQRPRCSFAPFPISSVTPGPTKAIPSSTSRERQRSLSHASRAKSRKYLRLNIPCARRKRTSGSAPPCSGGGSPRTIGGAVGTVRSRMTPVSIGPKPNCHHAAPMSRDRPLAERLLEGDRRALARAITLVENEDPDGYEVVRAVYPRTGKAAVFGFTGPPGVGKSTLIGALTKARRAADRTIGVLSIDPSSPFTHGAVLGDRIRLSEHFLDPAVFIRSMPNRGALGGLSEAALQAALLMDAAGRDDIFLETVGVGQAEVDIIDHADTVVLVLIPGSGDSIQALKAGVMEIPDIIVVNKADHPMTDTMVREIRGVLSLGDQKGWRVPIVRTQAHKGEGVEALAGKLREHRAFVEAEGTLAERRRRNLMNEVLGIATMRLRRKLEASLREDPEVQELLDEVVARRLDPASAASAVLARGAVDARDAARE